jgi:large subunit ribosomal protein L4e
MTNTDLNRLLKSDEIQAVLRAPIKENKKRVLKKNPLKNLRVMNRLNPYDKVMRKADQEQELPQKRDRSGVVDTLRGTAAPAKKPTAKKPVAKKPSAKK